jgi:hypothetical protein
VRPMIEIALSYGFRPWGLTWCRDLPPKLEAGEHAGNVESAA